MTLSGFLSKYAMDPRRIEDGFRQVDTFLEIENDEDSDDVQLELNKPVTLGVGKSMRNYFCEHCDDFRTFSSVDHIYVTMIDKFRMNISFVCHCPGCAADVSTWVLLESRAELYRLSPEIKARRYIETFPQGVSKYGRRYGEYSTLIESADLASLAGFHTAAATYLRQAFEAITRTAADNANIPLYRDPPTNEKKRSFKGLLEEVDKSEKIIPPEFSENGYKLFSELSEILHNECAESIVRLKSPDLFTLIIGVIQNVQNKTKHLEATKNLGW